MGKLSGCFLLLLTLLISERAIASHAMGTDIAYECLGNNNYRITIAFYRDCAGITAPNSIIINYFAPSCGIPSSSSFTQTLQRVDSLTREVSPLCPADLPSSRCRGGTKPGVEQFIYTGIINLTLDCSDWIVGYAECCRNSVVTNLASAASYNLYAYAQINNMGGLCNNSPIFTYLPVPYICVNRNFNYNHGAVDIDGDSLVFHMVQPSHNYQVYVPYQGGFSVNYPMSTTTTTFQFDAATGQMSLTPDIPQFGVVTVQVEEYRNGVLIGSTMRDIQIVVLQENDCANELPEITQYITNISGGGILDSNRIQMCPGSSLSFEMEVSDTDGNNVFLSSNASTAIPGSNFTTIGTGSTMRGRFTWVPAFSDSGFHAFQVTYSDDGCPLSTPQTISYVINVFNRVSAGADRVYCGDPIQLYAIGGSSFTWTPATGLSQANIANPVATPLVPTLYRVTSDCGVDSIYIDVQPSYSVSAGNDTAICLNALAQLRATVSTPDYGPYAYSWSPPATIDNPASQSTSARPLVPTTFYLTAVSAQGCVKYDTMRVSISGVAPSVSAKADPARVCVGETTRLDVSVRPSSCIVTTTPCTGTPVDYAVGAGTQQTANNINGTPYRGSYEDARVQYLLRASELNALGITGGAITKLAFNVLQKRSGTTPYNNFTIRIGCTDLNAMPKAFISGLSPVFGPTAYTSTAGWNTHNFSSPYDWDGISNLIVQICFDNPSQITSLDDDVAYTSTSFTSVAYRYDGLTSGCSLASADTTRTRPNMRVTLCSRLQGNTVIDWSVVSGSATISDPSIHNPTSQVFGTTKFWVDVSTGGCAGQDEVTVIVDTAFTVRASPDTMLCQASPIQLNAVGTGQPSPIYLTCGVNGTPAGTSTVYQFGNSPGLSSNPTPFKGGSHDMRMQMLYKRTELDAEGMSRGVFTSIAFNVAFKSSLLPFRNFTIKMGCTNLDELGNVFIANLQEVFSPKDVNSVVGWNILDLDNYFDWDGYSNIVIEICFDNSNTSYDDIITYTPTAFTSVIDTSADYSAGCALPVPKSGGSFFRPNIRFGVSPPPPSTFSYSWSPAATLNNSAIQNPIASPVSSTTYVVTMTDGICIATDTATINFYTTFNVNVYGTNIGCNGAFDGNAVSVPVGGVTPYIFIWSTGRTVNGVPTDTLYDLVAGTYHITVIDNNGCDAMDSVTITVPPPLFIDAIDVRNVNCFGGNSGTALASGIGGTPPYSYSWSSGANGAYATQLTEGTFMVTLTDASGCTADSFAVITEPTPITSSVSVIDASCYKYSDGSATISASGGTPPYSYAWSDNQTDATASGLNAGLHIVSVTDDSACAHLDTAIVSHPDSFSITISETDASCFGGADGSASASVAGDTVNYSFLWNTQPSTLAPSVSGLSAGALLLTVTDTAGCEINSNIVIGSPAEIILSTSFSDVSCFGLDDGSASVSVISGGIPPFVYQWSNAQSNQNISGLMAGAYYITVEDNNSCVKLDTVMISEPDPIVILDSIIDASCFGSSNGRVLVIVQGGTPSFLFSWSDGQATPIASNLFSGVYSVTVTDQNGCTDSLHGIFVEHPTQIIISGIEIIQPCSGEASGVITFSSDGGTPPYRYELENANSQSNPAFTGVTEGDKQIAVIDDNGCRVDSNILVIPHAPIGVAFDSSEININLGQEVTLNPIIHPQDSAVRFSWEPPTGLSCSECQNPVASPFITTAYQLTVFDEHNCAYREEIVVNVSNNLILVVPNAFSPNNDGINDILYVYGISVLAVKFRVFDKWGEKVFESRSMDDGWDGTFRGKMQLPGVYVYYVEAVFEDGQEKQIKGSTLILK